ncbi:hypothetical protein K439DRAFT_1631106 [Ramaria rubella]|nr:hypothetical protein K439DRAFT_1631106 [Ramaria rubella]
MSEEYDYSTFMKGLEERRKKPLKYTGPPTAQTNLGNARNNINEILAVRIYCDGDKRQPGVGTFAQTYIPKDHPVFKTTPLPVSRTLQLPLVMEREGSKYPNRADLDCQIATYLAIDTKSGFAPPA